jgi:hypothetical protein
MKFSRVRLVRTVIDCIFLRREVKSSFLLTYPTSQSFDNKVCSPLCFLAHFYPSTTWGKKLFHLALIAMKLSYLSTNNNTSTLSADPLGSNNQFQITQVETIAFGVLSALLAFIGVVFAYLQLRQMYHLQTTQQDAHGNDVEIGLCSCCRYPFYLIKN